MKNSEKHKTPGARSKAFAKFCEGRKSCDYCELGFNKMPEGSECPFYWLELEAKTNARNKNGNKKDI